MQAFKEPTNMEEIDHFLEEQPLAFLYIYRDNCSVCHALMPQVKRVLEDYPEIQVRQVNADTVPEIAGRFSIFTVPVLLLFADGKEVLRKARFVQMAELENQLGKITEAYSV